MCIRDRRGAEGPNEADGPFSAPWLGADYFAVEDPDPLHLRLDAVARLEEVAGGGAHTLGRAGGDDVAGQEHHALREHVDALGDREDHLRGVARLAQLAIHPE